MDEFNENYVEADTQALCTMCGEPAVFERDNYALCDYHLDASLRILSRVKTKQDLKPLRVTIPHLIDNLEQALEAPRNTWTGRMVNFFASWLVVIITILLITGLYNYVFSR